MARRICIATVMTAASVAYAPTSRSATHVATYTPAADARAERAELLQSRERRSDRGAGGPATSLAPPPTTTTTKPRPSKTTAAPVPPSTLGLRIMACESGSRDKHGKAIIGTHNYKMRAFGPARSGAASYLDTTWNNYGGYAYAALAPQSVQDQRFYSDLSHGTRPWVASQSCWS